MSQYNHTTLFANLCRPFQFYCSQYLKIWRTAFVRCPMPFVAELHIEVSVFTFLLLLYKNGSSAL